MRINQNTMAMNAHRNLSGTQNSLGKSLEKLSSGFRINRAGDDAAGLVISENLRSQVGGLKVATRNAQDGISVMQTAEGALTEVHSMLQRARDLAVQASNTGANGGETGASVAAAQAELDELIGAIDDIANDTKFNGTNLLNGTSTLSFQVGANGGETISVTMSDMNAAVLGTGASFITALASGQANDFDSSAGAASAAIAVIDAAISQVSSFRGTLGATQNRLEHTINNLQVATENLSASESRVRDVDMAQEMTNFTRSQILSQAGTAMLSQANAVPQGVLSLLG
ncbi:Flagellin protein FlaA [Euzebya pacifica]|uniref:Flagellin n=1 Tax=Euzebya pacifica TaxID=1608957 RepID=A0A346XUI8_9ACTN|nr:flagellin [Euzebya pacifica]AXV05885.1 Flagellin protein FlaA [Euzebya pacifica]